MSKPQRDYKAELKTARTELREAVLKKPTRRKSSAANVPPSDVAEQPKDGQAPVEPHVDLQLPLSPAQPTATVAFNGAPLELSEDLLAQTDSWSGFMADHPVRALIRADHPDAQLTDAAGATSPLGSVLESGARAALLVMRDEQALMFVIEVKGTETSTAPVDDPVPAPPVDAPPTDTGDGPTTVETDATAETGATQESAGVAEDGVETGADAVEENDDADGEGEDDGEGEGEGEGDDVNADDEAAKDALQKVIALRVDKNMKYLEKVGRFTLLGFFAVSTIFLIWALHDWPTDGSFGEAEKAIATTIAASAAAVGLLALLMHASGGLRGLFLGKDGRFSTSAAQAAIWTLAIFYGLLYLICLGLYDGTVSVDDTFSDLNEQYLLLLGGPFAAAAAARAAVTVKINNGTQQKQGAAEASVKDFISSDDGQTDLVDTQFFLFNLLTLAYFIGTFVAKPLGGLPDLPPGLVALTSFAALTYATNKAIGTNSPVLSSVTKEKGTGAIRAGDIVILRGSNFAIAKEEEFDVLTQIGVTIGGVKAAVVGRNGHGAEDISRTSLRVQVPVGLEAGAQDATVTTPAGAVSDPVKVEITEDKPLIVRAAPVSPRVPGTVKILGRYFTPPGSSSLPMVIVNDFKIKAMLEPALSRRDGLDLLSVPLPRRALAEAKELVISVTSASGLTSDPITLPVRPEAP